MIRKIKYSHSEVSVKVFHYENEEGDDFLKVNKFDLEDILSVTIDKNISNPSASFSLKLTSSQNWKKRVSPGDWLLIYMSNDGNKKLKLIGNVDRVSRSKEIDLSSGKMSVFYNIHGRNFGKVFEKMNIYINPFDAQSLSVEVTDLLPKFKFAGSPGKVVSKMIDSFLGGDIKTKLPQLKNQWFIPSELKEELGIIKKNVGVDGTRFVDILEKEITVDKNVGYKIYESFSSLQGFLWNALKQHSNDAINELFLELKEDSNGISRPTLVLRMIPFSEKNFRIEEEDNDNGGVGKVERFLKLPRVKISDDVIIHEDIGQSDHVKFNYFLMTATTLPFLGQNEFMVKSRNSSGENKIPRIKLESIKKNGLLLRTEKTDFAYLSGSRDKRSSNVKLLSNWNNLLVHWWENAHKMDSGTMRILYNPDIELGKTLEVNYTFLDETYIYYIEGYSINWSYPNAITMDLKLTRGQKLLDNDETKFIEEENTEDKIFTGQSKVRVQ